MKIFYAITTLDFSRSDTTAIKLMIMAPAQSHCILNKVHTQNIFPTCSLSWWHLPQLLQSSYQNQVRQGNIPRKNLPCRVHLLAVNFQWDPHDCMVFHHCHSREGQLAWYFNKEYISLWEKTFRGSRTFLRSSHQQHDLPSNLQQCQSHVIINWERNSISSSNNSEISINYNKMKK